MYILNYLSQQEFVYGPESCFTSKRQTMTERTMRTSPFAELVGIENEFRK